MVVGFNHNFTYKNAVYHIQTEDSGLKSPHIVTLLYHGGTILASRKTSYADITKVDNLEQVVEELMKEQHKGMLRSLKNGEFDDVIARYNQGAPTERPAVAPEPAPVPATMAEPSPSAAVPPAPAPSAPPAATTSPVPPTDGSPPAPAKPAGTEASLDEIILSYLMGEDK